MNLPLNRYFFFKQRDHCLSDDICQDLHIEELFAYLDHTKSRVGQQVLYDLLRSVVNKSVETHQPIIENLASNPSTNQHLQAQLSKLNHPDAYGIICFVSQQLPAVNRYYTLLIAIFRFVPFVFLLLTIFQTSGTSIVLLIASLLVNTFIHYHNKFKLSTYLNAASQFLVLHQVANTIHQNSLQIQ